MAPVASLPDRPSGSPTRRDPARRQELLQVAARVFAQSGFAATSMDDIAAAAGVSKLVAYRHFDTKEGLYRAVLEQVFQRQVELFVTYLAQGLEAGGATRALLDVAREWPDGFRLLWRHAVREPQFADYARELRNTAVTAAREVVEPVLAPNFTEWAAQTLFDHLVDAVLNWLDHGDARLDDEFVSTEAAALLATVAAWVRVHPAGGTAPGNERG